MSAATRPSSVSGAVTMAYPSVGAGGAGAMVAVAGVARGSAGVRSWLYLAVLPGLVGLVYGAERLRRRGGRTALLMAASLTAAAWAMTSVVGLMAYRDSVFVAFAAAPLLVVPLPVAAAARARPRERADRSAR